MSWINHLPPACWSTFRKSNSKQQLGCRFDIMDYESYFFVFWHMQLYMSWYIISFFGFTLLNILHFSSTLVLTFSYRRSLYTFYSISWRDVSLWWHTRKRIYVSISSSNEHESKVECLYGCRYLWNSKLVMYTPGTAEPYLSILWLNSILKIPPTGSVSSAIALLNCEFTHQILGYENAFNNQIW